MKIKLGTLLCKVPECNVKVNSIQHIDSTTGILEGSIVISNSDDTLMDICVPVNIKSIELDTIPSKKTLSPLITLVELITNCPPVTATVTSVNFELMETTGWSVIEFTVDGSSTQYCIVSYVGINEILGSEIDSQKPQRRKLK
jgi:hypothetical protein